MSPPKPIMKMQTQSKPRLVTGVAEKEQKDDYSTLIIGLILLIMIPGTSFFILFLFDNIRFYWQYSVPHLKLVHEILKLEIVSKLFIFNFPKTKIRSLLS